MAIYNGWMSLIWDCQTNPFSSRERNLMPGTAGLQIQCPNHQAMLPPMMYSACNALTVDCLEQLKDVDIIKIKEKQKVNDIT